MKINFMKKYLLLVLIAFVSFSAYAQNFSLSETIIEIDGPQSSNFEAVGYNEITNSLETTRSYTWTREEVSKTNGWETAVCDIVRCYLPDTDSESFELSGLESGRLDVHAYPNSIEGQAHIRISVTDNDDGSSAEADYYFNMMAPTSTGELVVRSIQVFPNPAADIINVTDSFNDIAEISVYNVIGRQVQTYNANPNGQYNVSDLKSGLYLMQLIDTKGAIIRTVRLNKN